MSPVYEMAVFRFGVNLSRCIISAKNFRNRVFLKLFVSLQSCMLEVTLKRILLLHVSHETPYLIVCRSTAVTEYRNFGKFEES